jgi:hypothetical protein
MPTQTQEVVINDVTAPVADVPSLSDVASECEITSLTAPTATDNCEGTITGTHNATLPITASTTVTWTYDDGNGNTSTQTQDVVINDVTAPVADVTSLSDAAAECEVTSLTAPTATDNCEGTITGTHNATFPITASTTVTWTYDDGNGNTSTQTQEVVITPIDNSLTQIGAVTLEANASGYNYQWVDCNNGNAAIAGETAQAFIATVNGSYAVELNNGTCTVTSNCVQVLTVGIQHEDENLISVYPNPTNGEVRISIDNTQGQNLLRIFNMNGKLIHEEPLGTQTAFDLQLPEEKGVYLVQVLGSFGTATHKVVAQ